MIIIAINDTTSDIEIADMNYVIIPEGTQRDLTNQFPFSFIMESENLKDYVADLDIIINDGTSDLSAEDGLEHIIALTEYEIKGLLDHNLDDHLDVPTPPAGDKMLESQDGIYSWVDSVAGSKYQSLTWSQNPTHNGVISLIGWHINTDTSVSLVSGSPINASENGYHSHFVINVTSGVGLPFTIRITGISIDESTGATTSGDTEDINISNNGFFQSIKSWVDDVQFSIVENSKSCTIDIYRTTYWDRGNRNFCIEGSRLEWEPDAAAWSIQVLIHRVTDSGELIIIDNTTLTSTDDPDRGETDKYSKYKRGNYNFNISGVNKEGIIVSIDQQSIRTFFLEVKYSV